MPVEGSALQPLKADPHVQMPPAVRAAAARAEQLAAEAKAAREAAPPGSNDPVRVAPFIAPNNPGVVMTNFDPKNPQPPGEPSRPQLSVVQPTPQAPQVPTPGSDDWEHQFKSLKGRYDREAENTRRMAAQITDMQRLLASVSAPSQSTPQFPQGSMPVPPEQGSGVRFTGPASGASRVLPRRLTDKEVTDYGSDLIDVMGRRAMEVQDATLLPVLNELRGELAQLRQSVGGVRQTVAFDATTRMYNDLRQEVPNWKDINAHPEFVRWLKEPDDLSGEIRQELLDKAYNTQQTNRVIKFFKSFLADQATLGLQTPNPQPGNGAGYQNGPASTPQVDLAQFAAPGRAKPGQTVVTPEKPIITVSEISQFYRDKIAGKYAGRDDEMNNIEREIYAAGREGRVKK